MLLAPMIGQCQDISRTLRRLSEQVQISEFVAGMTGTGDETGDE
jgi:hypothetical protein